MKHRPARRNAWGAASYADLIAAAIDSSPDKRLTLSQIYDWMVTNVKYFSDRADSNSSAGWKVIDEIVMHYILVVLSLFLRNRGLWRPASVFM